MERRQLKIRNKMINELIDADPSMDRDDAKELVDQMSNQSESVMTLQEESSEPLQPNKI